MTTSSLKIGDSAPWFDAETIADTRHNLGVLAGRWVALFFIDSLNNPHATRVLAELVMARGRFFNDDHVVLYAVMQNPPPPEMARPLTQASHGGLGFMMDYEKKISRVYGAEGVARLVLLDPMLRVAKILAVDATTDSAALADEIGALPRIDDSAGVPLSAPALMIPRVFEPEFCQYLIGLYEKNGGKDSGFMLDKDGKTMTVINHGLKQRSDFFIEDPAVREEIRDRIVRGVVPMMERFFSYRPTRMDRYLVSCYDAETGGHFSRHRDNVNAGAQHRRFAASFNLNTGYDGCDLIFPEFGRREYRAPFGGGIVFATGALHQVTPVTRGRRYAFVPFFYGEDEARLRQSNNARLHAGESQYSGENDLLFP